MGRTGNCQRDHSKGNASLSASSVHPGEEDDVAAVVTLGGDLAPEQAAAGHDLAQGEVCAVAEAVGRHALLQLESMRMSDYFE